MGRSARSGYDTGMNIDSAEMSQAKELVAIVSHELRNPLACIGGYAKLLMDTDKSPDERARILSRILSSSRFMEQIIGGVLDGAALERDELPMARNSVALPELLQKSLEDMEHSASSRGVALVLAASNARRPVLGDAARLRQVLVNLVSNAIKHVPPGTGRVSVGLHDLDSEFVVEVADNGAGISPEHLGRIFEKFYQAGEAKTRGSLGLGLFIARRIVDLHGGRMWARSAGLGKGASFYFSLPKHELERAYASPRLFAAPGHRILRSLAVAGVLAVMTFLLQRLAGRAPEMPAYIASAFPH